MKLESIRIKNFRSFLDETINLDRYTSFVGPNGAGKSAVLTALNIFFRNNAATSTDVIRLSEEDFHHSDTTQPIEITLTFASLSTAAQEDLAHYFRQGKIIVTAKAVWDTQTRTAKVEQHGSRTVMRAFAPFFEALGGNAKVPQLREIYGRLQKTYPALPSGPTKPAMTEALRKFEEGNPDKCELMEEPAQFYDWKKGSNRLAPYIQWVYVPAVKDATEEQDENKRSALGQLLERTVRRRVDFTDPIRNLKETLE